jgi:hypothetical protein
MSTASRSICNHRPLILFCRLTPCGSVAGAKLPLTCAWTTGLQSAAVPPSTATACYAATLEVRRSPLGNDEPITKVQLVELQEVAVPLMPRAAFEIRRQRTKATVAVGRRHQRVGRDARSHTRVKIRLGPTPERTITKRSVGSYDPAPAPTFTTDVASPSASRMRPAIRGSGRRVAE